MCIEVTDSIELVTSENACGFGTKYRSVISTGTVLPIDGLEQKIDALKIIMEQHTGQSEWEIPETAVSSVTLLKVGVDLSIGKSSGFGRGSR